MVQNATWVSGVEKQPGEKSPGESTCGHLHTWTPAHVDTKLNTVSSKPLSSKKNVHQKKNFHQKPLSSNTTFIQNHFHQKKNHFHQKTTFIKKNTCIIDLLKCAKKKTETKDGKTTEQKKEATKWDNQCCPCLCENVAGRNPATPSQKHGLCPPFDFNRPSCRRPKGEVERREFRCLGLMKIEGFGVLKFQGAGCRV